MILLNVTLTISYNQCISFLTFLLKLFNLIKTCFIQIIFPFLSFLHSTFISFIQLYEHLPSSFTFILIQLHLNIFFTAH